MILFKSAKACFWFCCIAIWASAFDSIEGILRVIDLGSKLVFTSTFSPLTSTNGPLKLIVTPILFNIFCISFITSRLPSDSYKTPLSKASKSA